MRIEFTKMQGLGNDFLIFDAPVSRAPVALDSGTLRALAHRHTGIGFDQALMLQPPRDPRHRVFYRVFNSDGSEVEQCGNGARCVAALLFARQPERGPELIMESVGGIVQARIQDDGLVAVNMGAPNFDPRALPMIADAERDFYDLRVDGEDIRIGAVSMGNPHAVLRVDNVKNAPLARFGPTIENHERFPKRANVGFMQIVDRGYIRLRVFERGVGETLACGTGACAAVAVGVRLGLLNSDVRVDLPGGTAVVCWPGAGHPVWLTGPAVEVFSGSIDI